MPEKDVQVEKYPKAGAAAEAGKHLKAEIYEACAAKISTSAANLA